MSDRVAQRFLNMFRNPAADGNPAEALAADIDGFAAAIHSAPEALDAAMAVAADQAGGAVSVVEAAFASAACTARGKLVVADPAFAAWEIPAIDLARTLAEVRETSSDRTSRRPSRLSAIAHDARGRPIAIAVAPPCRARAWPLGAAVRAALASGEAAYAILGVSGMAAGGGGGQPGTQAWSRGFAAWRFSPAEARLSAALLHTSDLRRAARDIGIAYETARDTLASAMARTGARRQPEFMRELALLAVGDLPGHDSSWQVFADTYGLSPRAARLAQRVALGATRRDAAAALGISDHSAKADLKKVYESCGIDSGGGGGPALGRIVAEIEALARLAEATDFEFLVDDAVSAPLRFVRRRRAPGRIAVEDHGPADGIPVIVFHVPVNGRHLPRVLVTALQARGLRPISVERPGFGLTSPADGNVVAEANADLVDVLDALGIARAHLLGRSACMPLAFAAAHPERFEAGVLLSASPPDYRPSRGFYGAFNAIALDRPALIDTMARFAMRISSDKAITRLTEKAISGCPIDIAAFADPQNRRDFIRASRQSSTGNGFVREFALHAAGVLPAAAQAQPWTVVFGECDPLGPGGINGCAAWHAALPRVRVEMIRGAGRLVHLSHPEVVAAALAQRA